MQLYMQYLQSLCLTLLFLGILRSVLWSRWGTQGACWLSLGGVGLLIFASFWNWGSAANFIEVLLTLLVTLLALIRRWSSRAVMWCAVGATLCGYGCLLWFPQNELRELGALRQEFPIVSLSDRLSYEKESLARVETDKQNASATPLPADVEGRLMNLEYRGRGNYRRMMLEALHDRTRDEFIAQRGFGVSRMLRVRREKIVLPENPPIPLLAASIPQSIPDTSDSVANALYARKTDPALLSERGPLTEMHQESLADFLEPERIGFVRDRDHVAGFQSHQFTKMPVVANPQNVVWNVARLDLVSLLKHPQPRVYVSEHLPRMDELRGVPTRPLNSFEESALKKLREVEDHVLENESQRIRMLGSIRAGKDCLQCHSVRRGDLLGAFSYEIVAQEASEGAKKE